MEILFFIGGLALGFILGLCLHDKIIRCAGWLILYIAAKEYQKEKKEKERNKP